jgi:hypothetical protein
MRQFGKKKTHVCPYCEIGFSKKYNLERHIEDSCRYVDVMLDNIVKLKKKITLKNKTVPADEPISNLKDQISVLSKRLDETVAKLEKEPRVVNNNLQVICVGSKDNYLDMLALQWNNFERALDYIKDCALSSLTGDCKLIEKIYFSNENVPDPIKFIDKKKNKLEYYNENEEKVIDNREMFCKKIANNLQNSYLKGVTHLINKNLENLGCPNKFLGDYDIQAWNQHIYELMDVNYHRKILNNLKIPCVITC